MNLQQLRSAREVAAENLNLSRAARRLNASQPAVTRHLQQLERSLGVALFVRRGRRLTGLTSAGRALLPIVARVLDGVEEMRRIARDLAAGAEGEVTVATIHTHARYVLPPAIERFLRDFPKVRLRVRQGSRAQVAAWVDQGEADFSLASAPKEPFPGLAFHPSYAVHRVVLARPDHALARLVGHRRRLTLEDVARHPVITYDHESEAWGDILDAFERRGLQANVVLSAVDADIMKTYVRSGLGVGIVAHIAYEAARDGDLRALDAGHLFPTTTVHLGVRRGDPLGRHALHLVGLFAPELRYVLEATPSGGAAGNAPPPARELRG
jgi:LysR family transcriptional regulator, cys regulon transcriptional activator